jgi:hypothetical protein
MIEWEYIEPILEEYERLFEEEARKEDIRIQKWQV